MGSLGRPRVVGGPDDQPDPPGRQDTAPSAIIGRMTFPPGDVVKRQVAAHWERRAAGFDEDFGHSIRTPGERAAWDRILDLVLPARHPLDALDVGCGTGFLSFELASRGHRVTGVDFAPAMLVQARRKAAAHGRAVTFEQADAEQLAYAPATFDLVISRHLLWTLPHPEAAITEWIRVLRPGGRLVVVDGQFDATALTAPPSSARASAEYAAIGDRLPFLGGRPREAIAELLTARALIGVRSDPLLDLVAAQEQRMVDEGLERRTHRRYVAWGDVPAGR
jgi:SAM-dependent methyltransferase